MYTIVAYFLDEGSSQTFSCSREFHSRSKRVVIPFMLKEFKFSRSNLDTLLVMKNGKAAPEVVSFWTAANGDL